MIPQRQESQYVYTQQLTRYTEYMYAYAYMHVHVHVWIHEHKKKL